MIDEAQVSAILARLGPDPLRRDADPDLAWERIVKSRKPIGALLMDQRVLAGVGNVYRSELLFRHHIDPYRPGRDVGAGEFTEAWTDLVDLMKVGVRRGKIIVVRPEHDHGRRPTCRTGRAPTSTAAPANPAGCAGRRSAPPNSKVATCSGARPARCEGSACSWLPLRPIRPASSRRGRENAPMELILVVVGAIVVTAVAHQRGLEPALIIVVVGIAASFLPGFAAPELDSQVPLTVVLPPLLYSAALDFSFPTFVRNIKPILGLGVAWCW